MVVSVKAPYQNRNYGSTWISGRLFETHGLAETFFEACVDSHLCVMNQS